MVNPIGGSSAIAGNKPDPNKLAAADFNQAASLLNKGDYKGAYELFTRILESKDTDFINKNPAIYYYTGLAADYSNHPTDALKNFNTYIKLPNAQPDLVKSAKVQMDLMAASAAMSSKEPDYAGALASYQDAIKLDPGLKKDLQTTVSQLQGQIDLDNANQAEQKNDLAGMLKWYSQAALDDPALKDQLAPTITRLQGRLYFQNNISPKVNAQIQQAYNLNYPPPGQTPNTLEAIRVLEGILTEYPQVSEYSDPSMIHAPLAQFKARHAANPPAIDGNQFQGHPEKALQILQSAVKKHPGILKQDPSVYYCMAQYAWAAGRIGQARSLMQEFAPYQAQYQQNFQDPTGPQQFQEQLSGSRDAVLENFQTYAANWIANHLHAGSAEWWQNNVLSSLQGWMPDMGEEWRKKYDSNFGASNRVFKTGKTYSSHSLHGINEQLDALREQQKSETDPAELAEINKKISALEEQQKTADFSTVTKKTARNSKGEALTDYTSSKLNPEQLEEMQGKGMGGEASPMAPSYWGMGQTLDMAAATYKTVGEVSAANPYQFDDMQLSGQTNLLNAEARTYNMVYAGGTHFGTGITAMRGAEARADLVDESYAANFQSDPDTIGGQQLTLINGGVNEYSSVGAQASGHGGITAGIGGVSLSGSGSAFAGAQAAAQSSLNFGGQGGYAMAQAWAGVGAKVHADASLSWKQGLHLDFGAGAALGVGGYAQVAVNVNLYAAGQDLVAATSSPTGLLKLVGDTETDAIANAPQLAITYAAGAKMVELGKELAKKAAEQFGKEAAEDGAQTASKAAAAAAGEDAEEGTEMTEMAAEASSASEPTVNASAAAAAAAGGGGEAGAGTAAAATTATEAAADTTMATLGAVEAGEASTGPVGWVALGVTAVASGIYEIATNAKKVGHAFKKAWDWFKGLF